jgi:hypothetical protein
MDKENKFTEYQQFVLKQAEKIKSICGSYYGMDVSDIDSNSRLSEIKEPRHISLYFIHKFFYDNSKGITLKFIGDTCHKDHATVLNSIKRVNEYLETDRIFKEKFDRIFKEINKNVITNFDEHLIDEEIFKYAPGSVIGQVTFMNIGDDGMEETRYIYEHRKQKLTKFNGNVPQEVISGEGSLKEFRKIILSI